MEASTLQQAPALPKPRITVGAPLLRFRSDEQLVALFRAGHEDAFRAIHDRYNKRLFAYARQMLPARQDAEDALQDVFVRAYAGLRASQRDLALKAWLFRVAHNRCVDELRKPSPPPPEVLQLLRTTAHDPVAELDRRESLRRLVQDIRRLPDQQRSALLMRELGGMSYAELASTLGISVGAVKSLLVRARLALAQASKARETACAEICEQLVEAHDRGVRPSATARKHMRDCSACKDFRGDLRGVSRQLAAVAPTLGPLGFLAQLVGFSGGSGAAGSAGGGAALLSGGGATASVGGAALSGTHLTALIVAAVATAGGAVEIQRTILPPAHHAAHAKVASADPHGSSAALAGTTASGASDVNASPSVAPADTETSRLATKLSATSATGAGGRTSLATERLNKKRAAAHRSKTGAATTTHTTDGSVTSSCAAAGASSNPAGTTLSSSGTATASSSGASVGSSGGGSSGGTSSAVATGGGSAASPGTAGGASPSGNPSCGTAVASQPGVSPAPGGSTTGTSGSSTGNSHTSTSSGSPSAPGQGTGTGSSGGSSNVTTG